LNKDPFRFRPLGPGVYGLRRFSRSAGLQVEVQHHLPDGTITTIRVRTVATSKASQTRDALSKTWPVGKDIHPARPTALIAPTPRMLGSVAANQNKPGIAVGTGTAAALKNRDL
jgi:hypothetical protein